MGAGNASLFVKSGINNPAFELALKPKKWFVPVTTGEEHETDDN